MIKEFQFQFEELNIQPENLEILMGYNKGEAPEPLPQLFSKALQKGSELCKIKGGIKILDQFSVHSENKTIEIAGNVFSPGKIVFNQIKRSEKLVLFLCTAGEGISQYSKELMASEDLMEGYIFDVLGSVTVDAAMDKIQDWLQAEMSDQSLNISNRYSPGYCDWHVSEQQMLFSLLPENFCGITLSDSSLMYPIKSVSGAIGIGKELKLTGYQCNYCSDKNCIYGQIRRQKKQLV